MWVSVEAVGGEDLAQEEEGRHCSVVEFLLGLLHRIWGGGENSALVFEDNVVAAEGPAVVAGIEMVAEWENTPG